MCACMCVCVCVCVCVVRDSNACYILGRGGEEAKVREIGEGEGRYEREREDKIREECVCVPGVFT